MLFNLTPELISQDHSESDKKKIKRAIEHILRSVSESKHLVISDLDTIIKLKQIITCSDSLSVLIYLENNYSFLNYDSIKYYVNVIVGYDNIYESSEGDCKFLNIPINYIQDSNLTNPTRILCEDISDASFFKIICNHYVINNNIGNISLCFEEEHGGGNQISRSFNKHINAKNIFCLAFADNDKKYPECQIGETLQKLSSIVNTNLLCKYISLECHEIENLIPFNYIQKIKKVYNEENGITFIENIIHSMEKESLKYFDIKKGINKDQISSSNDYLIFAKKLAEYSPIHIDFSNIEQYEKKHKIIPQVGKIMSSFIESNTLLIDETPHFLDFQITEWNKIGSDFLFWTCSRNKEPLNI